jgi:putative ABC transport system permease protein
MRSVPVALMSDPSRRRRSLEERCYSVLLRLYPADFRDRYGRQMADFHRDRIREAKHERRSTVPLWFRAIVDVAISAGAEHLQTVIPGEPVIRTIRHDLAYAVRGLARRPTFTLIVVATIALGVGANAAIFSVVDGILLKPLPYPDANRVVSFGHQPPHWLASERNFLTYHRDVKSFERLAAYTQNAATLTDGDNPERIRIVRATTDFFPALGVKPLIGRTFAADEFVGNPPTALVISYALWQRRFGADPAIVGKTTSINGVPRTIVGVMPPNFNFPRATTDVWSPMPPFSSDSLGGKGNHYLFMVGRLNPRVTVQSAFAEASIVAKGIMADNSDIYSPKVPLAPQLVGVEDQLVGGTRPYLFALLGAVGFVLLIACANVANLLLVRGESRQREMAVRSALGASRFRLLSQSLTESILLATIGGAIGLLFAWGGDRALVALAPSSIPRLEEIGIDWRVLVFCASTAMVTGLLIGVVPGWRAASGRTADVLKAGGRSAGSVASRVLRSALVIAEMTLAVVTLAGAGMLVRSLWHLQSNDLGFQPKGVLTAKIALPAREYTDQRTEVFFDEALRKLKSLPGVIAAGAVGWLPVVDAGGMWGFEPEGLVSPPGRMPGAVPQQATPGSLQAIGLRLVGGRDFTEADRDGAPLVAIVSEAFAKLAWPGQPALGKRFHLGGPGPLVTVVGIVRDIRARGFADTPEPTMYFAFAQSAKSTFVMPRSMALVVRTTGDAPAMAGSVREAVHSLDKTVPVSEVRTLEDVVGTSISTRKFNTLLLAGFAVLALVLSGIGTYGVISYGVSQRSFEIGVRVALGAGQRSVVALVISEGLRLAAVGLGVGMVVSIVVARAIRAMLVDVSALDLPSLALTATLLVIVALAATLAPAIRALRVSPLDVIRNA